ncbi:MAG: DNA gyrase inhibitor YacG [Planctomycetes bacterium]|nr:DNA gyrase inhibitor YacG [Planctomycetota bacterium]
MCPICRDDRNPVPRDSRFFPFCSERCRNRDLTAWLEEGYRVAGEPAGEGDLVDSEEGEIRRG